MNVRLFRAGRKGGTGGQHEWMGDAASGDGWLDGAMGIAVRDVAKRFGDFVALDGVSLSVPAGKLTALLGPSGSGKSTLLRVIAGLEQPDAGEVLILEEAATHLPPQKRGVGFVFQHYAAFRHMTVRENVAFGLKIQKRPRGEVRERVAELLRLVQLDGYGDRYPSQLSGGQRQRMALARALAVRPRVLLLDEPFGALDARVRKELRSWLRRLHEQMRVTTVLVTHDQEEAMEVADSIVVMNEGHIEQVGTPEELYEHPANEFVMHFIGQVNRIGESYVRPHDVDIHLQPTGDSLPAVIQRLVYLGYEQRVELVRADGQVIQAHLTRDTLRTLGLREGQTVHVTLPEGRSFGGSEDELAS